MKKSRWSRVPAWLYNIGWEILICILFRLDLNILVLK